MGTAPSGACRRCPSVAAGVDGVSLARFEQDLKGNLYKVWNRIHAVSKFSLPVFRPLAGSGGVGTRPRLPRGTAVRCRRCTRTRLPSTLAPLCIWRPSGRIAHRSQSAASVPSRPICIGWSTGLPNAVSRPWSWNRPVSTGFRFSSFSMPGDLPCFLSTRAMPSTCQGARPMSAMRNGRKVRTFPRRARTDVAAQLPPVRGIERSQLKADWHRYMPSPGIIAALSTPAVSTRSPWARGRRCRKATMVRDCLYLPAQGRGEFQPNAMVSLSQAGVTPRSSSPWPLPCRPGHGAARSSKLIA